MLQPRDLITGKICTLTSCDASRVQRREVWSALLLSLTKMFQEFHVSLHSKMRQWCVSGHSSSVRQTWYWSNVHEDDGEGIE